MLKKIARLFLFIFSVMSLFICTASANETITTDTIYINNVPITCYSNSNYGPYFIVSDLKKVHFNSIWNSENHTVKIVYSPDVVPLSQKEAEKTEQEVLEALKSNKLNFPEQTIEHSPILTLENTPLYAAWSPSGDQRADYAFANGHTLIKVQTFAQYYSLAEPISNESITEEVEFNTTIKTNSHYPICKDESGNRFYIKEEFPQWDIRSYWGSFYVTENNKNQNSIRHIRDITEIMGYLYIPFETSFLGKCSISENTITIEEISSEEYIFSYHSGPTQNMSYLPTAMVDIKLMSQGKEITLDKQPIFLSINGRLFIAANIFEQIPIKTNIIPNYYPEIGLYEKKIETI